MAVFKSILSRGFEHERMFNIGRRSELVKALEKDSDLRNDTDIKYIYSWLVKDVRNEFLMKLQKKMVKRLCKQLKIEIFKKDKIVFYQGDISDKLYCILNGSVEVWIKGEEVAHYNGELETTNELGRKVTTLGARSTFGELGLMKSSGSALRTATVRTCEVTEFLTIDKKDFDRDLAAKFNVSDICDKLAEFPLFRNVKQTILTVIALNTKRIIYQANKSLIVQGNEVSSLYLIESGECEICQTIERQQSRQSISLARLHAGQMFGSLENTIYPYTITSISNSVTLLVIHKDNISKRLRSDVMYQAKNILEAQNKLHDSLLKHSLNNNMYHIVENIRSYKHNRDTKIKGLKQVNNINIKNNDLKAINKYSPSPRISQRSNMHTNYNKKTILPKLKYNSPIPNNVKKIDLSSAQKRDRLLKFLNSNDAYDMKRVRLKSNSSSLSSPRYHNLPPLTNSLAFRFNQKIN